MSQVSETTVDRQIDTSQMQVSKTNVAIYRIPAICTVRLSDGVTSLLQDRIAVYQLGTEGYFPLSK